MKFVKVNDTVLFVGNSQSSGADLPTDSKFKQNYVSILEKKLSEIGVCCNRFVMSSLDIQTVNNHFDEIVLANSPSLIVFQFGIIECALRILPKHWRQFLGVYGWGKRITSMIHDRKIRWLNFLSNFSIQFQDVPLHTFESNIDSIICKVKKSNLNCCFVSIPYLSSSCLEHRLPGHNDIIQQYNFVLKEICDKNEIHFVNIQKNMLAEICLLDNFFVADTVHFSQYGHSIVAEELWPYISDFLLKS